MYMVVNAIPGEGWGGRGGGWKYRVQPSYPFKGKNQRFDIF